MRSSQMEYSYSIFLHHISQRLRATEDIKIKFDQSTSQPTGFFHLEGNINVKAYTNFALSLMMMRETNGRTKSWCMCGPLIKILIISLKFKGKKRGAVI